MICVGGIGAFAVASGHQVIAQREPRLRQIGFKGDGALQCDHGFIAAAGATQRNAKFKLRLGPVGLRLRERPEDFGGLAGVSTCGVRGAEHQDRHRMVADRLDDFRGLLARKHGIGLQQPRRMRECDVEGGSWLGHAH